MVYQSAGLARYGNGMIAAIGPHRVERLDLDRGQLDTLLEDDAFDYLCPLQLADGSLLCVRRPYRVAGHRDWRQAVRDTLLFPWRLILTAGALLNMMSVFFRQQPLWTAGGPRRSGDARGMMIHGQWVQAQREAKRNAAVSPIRVPADWVLLRIDPDGEPRVLREGVLCFDAAADGSLLVSDGHELIRIDEKGVERRLTTAARIERVVAV